MTFNELADAIHEQAQKSGFHDFPRRLPEVLMLASSELGEAFEQWRRDSSVETGGYYTLEGKPEGWGIEIVDCIIVCLDIMATYKMDVDFLIGTKMEYNMSREPLHGKGI